MEADTAQEDGLVVQIDIFAFYIKVTETNLLVGRSLSEVMVTSYSFGASGDQRCSFGFDSGLGNSVGIGSHVLSDAQFGDGDLYVDARLCFG